MASFLWVSGDRTIFPQHKKVQSPYVVLRYDDAVKLFAKHFALAKLQKIFDSAISTEGFRQKVETIISQQTEGSIGFTYEYDKLTYRMDFDSHFYYHQGKPWYSMNIRLSNDGFLYKKETDYEGIRGPFSRHHSTTWYKLPLKAYNKEIATCFKFFRGLLKIQKVRSVFWYNSQEERIEVQLIDTQGSQKLNITFEPGYPELDFNENLWDSDDDDQN
eukprot:CAMPEP_0201546356 /NCGR_PEP_ID=MMETSP0173_2-20130828/2656_1 /ASSEMBLY_ACC=CAM_ASM_000268 /TAXON_ID=218659 /ORGANISM="Vexillifera sp., Strain DIVA3 564/2" /LENGTH=216 /DNA_ID=CAMNT_0047954991 /DNA_START=24 /DNA_END=674 /DNA_ORIENTATION=+